MAFGEDMTFFEGRMEVIMEQIRDALMGIQVELSQLNQKLDSFEECVETRTQLKMIRVADMTRKQ